jgi:hypothetical protein
MRVPNKCKPVRGNIRRRPNKVRGRMGWVREKDWGDVEREMATQNVVERGG